MSGRNIWLKLRAALPGTHVEPWLLTVWRIVCGTFRTDAAVRARPSLPH